MVENEALVFQFEYGWRSQKIESDLGFQCKSECFLSNICELTINPFQRIIGFTIRMNKHVNIYDLGIRNE